MMQNLAKSVSQLGVINALLYSINRFCSRYSLPISIIKYYFAAQPLKEQPTLSERRGRDLSVIEIPANVSGNPFPRPENVIKDRYAQGAVCLGAYKGGELAGYIWYIANRYQEDEVRCQYQLISKDCVWDFDVYVDPKYRLTSAFLKLWDVASAKLVNEGYRWSISRISAFNAMSLNSHKRMGLKIIGWAVFITIGKVQVTFSDLAPCIHFSLGEQSFPVFRLKPPNL